MTIKTYPLQFTEEKLKEIEKVAGVRKIKSFIYEAIEEKIKKDTRKEKLTFNSLQHNERLK